MTSMTDEKHFLCRVERLTIGSEVFQWNALGNCPLPLPVSICTTDEEIEMAPLQYSWMSSLGILCRQ